MSATLQDWMKLWSEEYSNDTKFRETADRLFKNPLLYVYVDAINQASFGKGEERHGHGRDFTDQPIFHIAAMTGPRGPLYQVIKKAGEAIDCLESGTFTREQAYNEILGALVYLGAVAIMLKPNPPQKVTHESN